MSHIDQLQELVVTPADLAYEAVEAPIWEMAQQSQTQSCLAQVLTDLMVNDLYGISHAAEAPLWSPSITATEETA